jgi:hypothetical protein
MDYNARMEQSELEIARLHVASGRMIITKQKAKLMHLRKVGAAGDSIAAVESTIATFEMAQRIFEEHVAALESEAAKKPRPK